MSDENQKLWKDHCEWLKEVIEIKQQEETAVTKLAKVRKEWNETMPPIVKRQKAFMMPSPPVAPVSPSRQCASF